MSLLKPMGQGQGWLKAGLLGDPKSGKTYTAVLLALGVRKFFKMPGPVAFFDTEGGSEYVADRVKKETGTDLIGVRAHSFEDMVATAREAEKEGVAALIVDSVTHPWRELCEAHLSQINAQRRAKHLSPRYRLEFQDWTILKTKWAEWTNLYLNSQLHIIVCGREGGVFEFEANEETGKKELIKTGVKMKTEGEFGFEPSLLVRMEREQILGDKPRIVHRATVLGDRFGVIDTAQCDNPGFDFFLPHVQLLKAGAHAPIDTEVKTDTGVDEMGDAQWQRDKRDRVILAEEIQGELLKLYPGQTAKEKAAKMDLIELHFGTRSWTKVETQISPTVLREGLKALRKNGATASDFTPLAQSDKDFLTKKQSNSIVDLAAAVEVEPNTYASDFFKQPLEVDDLSQVAADLLINDLKKGQEAEAA